MVLPLNHLFLVNTMILILQNDQIFLLRMLLYYQHILGRVYLNQSDRIRLRLLLSSTYHRLVVLNEMVLGSISASSNLLDGNCDIHLEVTPSTALLNNAFLTVSCGAVLTEAFLSVSAYKNFEYSIRISF